MTDPIQFPQLLGPKAAERPDALSSGTASKAPGAAGKDFKTVLLQSLDEVNRLQSEADAGVARLITGETDNVAEVFTAVNKAGIAFDLLMEARNRLVDAYQEIQQMRL